jgi:hypothetical protein
LYFFIIRGEAHDSWRFARIFRSPRERNGICFLFQSVEDDENLKAVAQDREIPGSDLEGSAAHAAEDWSMRQFGVCCRPVAAEKDRTLDDPMW